jgi:UDP-N-acetyl-D-mannosaminuronate dehydrogenase
VHRVDSPETAEMAKLWENTFRAVNIALANELADSCLTLGLEPLAVSVAYTGPYVPTLARGPRVLTTVADPAARHWDLIIVHTRHPGWDLSWVPDSTPILDPTHNALPEALIRS